MKSIHSIKKNYFYNVINQVVLIVVPLITTPYLSRILTSSGIGKFSFSFSIITYFTIFSSLGFSTYAQREIAKCLNNREKKSVVFWEIFLCRLLFVISALLVNIILFLFGVYGDYSSLLIILSLSIINVGIDISFFYQGNEEFGQIVAFNVFSKIAGTICIFCFVNSKNDLPLYTFIYSMMFVVENILLWIILPKKISKIDYHKLMPFKHLKGTLVLFIPTIATSIYTVLDKTLIGVLITDTYSTIENGTEVIVKYSDIENGYYEQAEKLVRMALTIITCLGSVMIPRNTKEIAAKNYEKVKENIYTSSKIAFLIGVPMTFGLILISDFFVPWFYGIEYMKCSTLISIFSFLVLAIGMSNVFGLQFLVPFGRDKEYSFSLICGAIVNIILNIFLIKKMWSIGAALASVIAELTITIIMGIMIRKEISILKIIKGLYKYLIGGIVMTIALLLFKKALIANIFSTFLLVFVGMIIYFITLFFLNEEIVKEYAIKMVTRIRKGKAS